MTKDIILVEFGTSHNNIKNRRNSSTFKDCSPRLRRGFGGQALQVYRNLKEKYFTIAYFSYTSTVIAH